MWKHQSRDESDDQTVEGAFSDDAKSDGSGAKKKGKQLKEPRGANVKETIVHIPSAETTPTAVAIEENLPIESAADPAELTQVVVEPAATETKTVGIEGTTSEAGQGQLKVTTSTESGETSQSSSRPASGTSSPKTPLTPTERARLRKKKSNKKK